jgi:hypothetical protein
MESETTPQTDRKVLFNFRITESPRDQIRLYCAKHHLTQTEFVTAALAKSMKEDEEAKS